jgi:hypothetical protein
MRTAPGASLALQAEIDAFTQLHWAAQPWVKDVARVCKERLDGGCGYATSMSLSVLMLLFI